MRYSQGFKASIIRKSQDGSGRTLDELALESGILFAIVWLYPRLSYPLPTEILLQVILRAFSKSLSQARLQPLEALPERASKANSSGRFLWVFQDDKIQVFTQLHSEQLPLWVNRISRHKQQIDTYYRRGWSEATTIHFIDTLFFPVFACRWFI